jgi:hypothetical protein
MEDSSASNAKNTDTKIPFGMSSFGENSRQQFGENIRLAMHRRISVARKYKGHALG